MNPLRTLVALGVAIILVLRSSASEAENLVQRDIVFEDGAIGRAETRCGVGDAYASLHLAEGDRIVLYNAGAAKCKPYQLRIVRMHGDAVMFSSEQQTNQIVGQGLIGTALIGCQDMGATFTVGQGHRLVVYGNKDGTLGAEWEGQSAAFLRAEKDAVADPHAPHFMHETLWNAHDASLLVDGHPPYCTPDLQRLMWTTLLQAVAERAGGATDHG